MRLIDSYFYKPLWWQKIIIFALLPLSCLYCLLAFLRRKISPKLDFHIPIISVGNLVVGGSGKTPFIIEVARLYPHKKIAILSRGYKRKSKGLLVVSNAGKIQCQQEEAGDEPYLIAKSLKHASVIVCKNRTLGIQKAKEMGCELIFLDDGFRFNYQKLNLLLKPKLKPYYPFCLPSGMYREWIKSYDEADLIVQEGTDYEREVCVKNPTERMLLLTAIANPSRLDEFLPSVVGKIFYPDHASFSEEKLIEQFHKHEATSLLVTSKDYVKLENIQLPISLLELKLNINQAILDKIDSYIQKEDKNTKRRQQ